MLIIPSIDLLGGLVVRLRQGRYEEAKVYGGNAPEIAAGFERSGARRIHLVDLDAARGSGDNRALIREIRGAVRCTVEVGGGVRTERQIEELVACGVDRVVIGTALAKSPDDVAAWASRHRLLLAGIDAEEGRVRIAGWRSDSGLLDLDLARKARDVGMVGIVYTDISRDGTLEGPSLERSSAIARASGLPVILSGGIRSADDFQAASRYEGIVGAIAGTALYERRVDLAEAIRRFQSERKEEETW